MKPTVDDVDTTLLVVSETGEARSRYDHILVTVAVQIAANDSSTNRSNAAISISNQTGLLTVF